MNAKMITKSEKKDWDFVQKIELRLILNTTIN